MACTNSNENNWVKKKNQNTKRYKILKNVTIFCLKKTRDVYCELHVYLNDM